MQTSLILGLALTLGAPAVKEPPKKEEATILGEWVAEKMIAGGMERPAPAGGAFLTFTGDGKLNVIENGKPSPENATYTIDLKKTPHEIDLSMANKKEAEMKGIFKIEGDTLTICLAPPFGGAERPTKFESPAGGMQMLMILKRPKK